MFFIFPGGESSNIEPPPAAGQRDHHIDQVIRSYGTRSRGISSAGANISSNKTLAAFRHPLYSDDEGIDDPMDVVNSQERDMLEEVEEDPNQVDQERDMLEEVEEDPNQADPQEGVIGEGVAGNSRANPYEGFEDIMAEAEEEMFRDLGQVLNANLFKNLKDKMHWESVPPWDWKSYDFYSYRPIPEWSGSSDPLILNVNSLPSPVEYYHRFMDKEICKYVVDQSNLYSVQQDVNKPLNLTMSEFERYVGICMFMSIVKLPRTRYYWKNEIHFSEITDYMSRRRWEVIKTNLHFANNRLIPEIIPPNFDKLFKIRPFVDMVNLNFNKLDMTENLSVDEMMIPYCGTRGPRVYVKGKPNPWGFKAFVLADSFGIVYNMLFSVGSCPRNPGLQDLGSTGNIVLKLCSLIPSNLSHKVTMDNYFTSVPLFHLLLSRGIHSMGTLRMDRAHGLNVIEDKDLMAEGKSAFREYRGSFDNGDHDMRVVRWSDNKVISLIYTYGSAYPMKTCQRWDRSSTPAKKVTVDCPGIVQVYNTNSTYFMHWRRRTFP